MQVIGRRFIDTASRRRAYNLPRYAKRLARSRRKAGSLRSLGPAPDKHQKHGRSSRVGGGDSLHLTAVLDAEATRDGTVVRGSGPRGLLLFESIEPEGSAFALIERHHCKRRDRRHHRGTKPAPRAGCEGPQAGARARRRSAFSSIQHEPKVIGIGLEDQNLRPPSLKPGSLLDRLICAPNLLQAE